MIRTLIVQLYYYECSRNIHLHNLYIILKHLKNVIFILQ
jgi:hypothetical protein